MRRVVVMGMGHSGGGVLLMRRPQGHMRSLLAVTRVPLGITSARTLHSATADVICGQQRSWQSINSPSAWTHRVPVTRRADPRWSPHILGLGLAHSYAASPRNLISLRGLSGTTGTSSSATSSGSGDGPESTKSSSEKRSLKMLIREYGPIAILVYFTLSTTVFILCLTSITFLGINEQTVANVFTYIKSLVGLGKKKSKSEEDQAEHDAEESAKKESGGIVRYLPEFLRSPSMLTLITNILLAMAMTKLFLPLKLGVVVAVTPTVAKRLRAMGFDFGKQPYREMAVDARDRIKDRAADARERMKDRADGIKERLGDMRDRLRQK